MFGHQNQVKGFVAHPETPDVAKFKAENHQGGDASMGFAFYLK